MRVIVFKAILSFLCVAGGCLAANAQSGEDLFRYALEIPDTVSGAVVRITEHGSAADVVNGRAANKPQSVPGYRVRIFFGNKQTARQDAMAVQEKFRNEFPSIPTYLVYENPAFIVTVGNCSTMEEALILQSRLKNRFSTAFLWRGEIPLDEFLREGDPLPPQEPADVPEDGPAAGDATVGAAPSA